MPTPKQMEKLAAESGGRLGRSAAAPDAPSRPNTGNRYSKTLAPARPGPGCGRDVFRKFSAADCASPTAAASGPWKSRLPMQSDCMAATRSGRTSRSGCSTTPASSAPAGMKKTGAGRRSRRPSPLRIADSISLRLDVRMAPKYHPTPLSGGDRKALTRELGKARAMANRRRCGRRAKR
jgi:hypothetical protein